MGSQNIDSYPVVVFFPKDEVCEKGYLLGQVTNDDLLKTTNFFIHEVIESAPWDSHNIIGVIGDFYTPKRRKKNSWIKLKVENKMPNVVELINIDNIREKQVDCQIIMFDRSRFLKSELLLTDSDGEPDHDSTFDDHFKLLGYSLKHMELSTKIHRDIPNFLKLIFLILLFCLKHLDSIVCWIHYFLKSSTLVNHTSMFIKSAIWGLEYVIKKKKFTSIKIGNYILGLIGDWIGGLLLIFWLLSVIRIEDVLQTLAVQSEVVVIALRDTVSYLMGSPADLKLNGPLNNVLGRFFLFHIDLWWAFLGFSRPLLELGFRLFLCLGSLGLSFQLAILADLLAIATFHIYVIYVYAAKLYHAQVVGLATLSQVFIGRKRNPLPGLVDSCPYSTEQLLIGTIAFTVLLFLLPTTLVYYIVFTVMRLALISVSGLVTQTSLVLRALPLYSTVLWLCNSPATTSCVRLTPRRTSHGQCVLEACPVQGPWWPTVKSGSPFPSTPSSVPWRELCCHLFTGTLLYPV